MIGLSIALGVVYIAGFYAFRGVVKAGEKVVALTPDSEESKRIAEVSGSTPEFIKTSVIFLLWVPIVFIQVFKKTLK